MAEDVHMGSQDLSGVPESPGMSIPAPRPTQSWEPLSLLPHPITAPFPAKEAPFPRAGFNQAAWLALGPADGSGLCAEAFKAPRFI